MQLKGHAVPRVVVTRPTDFPAFIAHCAIDSVWNASSFPAVQCSRGTLPLT